MRLSWTRHTLLPDRKYCSYPFVIMKSAWWDSRLTLLPMVCRELLPLAFLLHLFNNFRLPCLTLFKRAKALFSQILLSILLCCGVEDLSSLFRRSSSVSSLMFRPFGRPLYRKWISSSHKLVRYLVFLHTDFLCDVRECM